MPPGHVKKTNLPSASFSHVTLNFAMHIVPAPEQVLADAHRLLRPGGVFGFTVWDAGSAGCLPDLRGALAALPFAGPAIPDPFPMAVHGKPEWITEAGIAGEIDRFNNLTANGGGAGGFADVEVRTRIHTVRVDSPEQFVRMFAPMVQWITTSFWDDASRARAAEAGFLDRHIVEYLREKYKGQGWNQHWTYIVASCRKYLAT